MSSIIEHNIACKTSKLYVSLIFSTYCYLFFNPPPTTVLGLDLWSLTRGTHQNQQWNLKRYAVLDTSVLTPESWIQQGVGHMVARAPLTALPTTLVQSPLPHSLTASNRHSSLLASQLVFSSFQAIHVLLNSFLKT